jgi:hypothetical protein
MAIKFIKWPKKYTNILHSKALQNMYVYPNWDFCLQLPIPSGNPGLTKFLIETDVGRQIYYCCHCLHMYINFPCRVSTSEIRFLGNLANRSISKISMHLQAYIANASYTLLSPKRL